MSKGLPSKKNIQHDPYETYRLLPLDASAATLRLLAIPQHLLNLSILLYLIGFGLYLLLRWMAKDKESDDYCKIFVVYLAVFLAAFIDYVNTSAFLLLDARKRYTEFGVGSFSFHKSTIQKTIESSLTELQHVLKSGDPDSTHQGGHDSLRKIVEELEALLSARKARRQVSRIATDKELCPAQWFAQDH